jgi:hypothetical protein
MPEDYWSSDAGAEFLDNWFSIPKICQYFTTRSPATMADIDGWHARDIIAPSFLMTILTFITLFVSGLFSPTLLVPSTHPL